MSNLHGCLISSISTNFYSLAINVNAIEHFIVKYKTVVFPRPCEQVLYF